MPPQEPLDELNLITGRFCRKSFWYRLLWWMLACELMLVILNIWTPDVIARSVHLDRESNFVVWFSSSQLLLASLTVVLVSMRESVLRARLPWLLLALLLLLLSIDETAMLHESLGPRLTFAKAEIPSSDAHWLAQSMPMVIGSVVFLCWLIFYGFRNDKVARRLMFIALLCWCLSLTGEWIQHNSNYLLAGLDAPHLYKAAWMLEEFLEMAGASLLWSAIGLRLCSGVTMQLKGK